ncbi:MAG: hypothetical protein QNJ09_00340 [Paracoccaceae bacterium]|nr:hypothetical protein [Paracoccaceae bacterium]
MKSFLLNALTLVALIATPEWAQSAGRMPIAPVAQAPDVILAGSRYTIPQRGSAERQAIMDAARVPIGRELTQPVIFLVDVLRSDGDWVYLQGTPLTPAGNPIDWNRTPMAEAWQMDAMSDVVMVLLRRQGAGFEVVDYVIGPTDVFWYVWVDDLGLPEALFYQE